MFRFTRVRIHALVLLAGMACVPAFASGATMQDLLQQGATIQSGDKIFYGFHSYLSSGDSPVDPATLFVASYQDAVTHEYGLLFSSASFFTVAGQTQTTAFHFDVRPGDSNFLISGNTLKMTASQLGGGAVGIIEDVYTQDELTLLAHESTALDAGGGNLYDHQLFSASASVIHVSKTITLDGGPVGAPGLASLSDFSQTFSQVPEPTTLVLLLAGGLALRRRGRRRRVPAPAAPRRTPLLGNGAMPHDTTQGG